MYKTWLLLLLFSRFFRLNPIFLPGRYPKHHTSLSNRSARLLYQLRFEASFPKRKIASNMQFKSGFHEHWWHKYVIIIEQYCFTLTSKVKPVLIGHPRGMLWCPLNTGCPPNTGFHRRVETFRIPSESMTICLCINFLLERTNQSKHYVKVINDASTYRKVTDNLVTL